MLQRTKDSGSTDSEKQLAYQRINVLIQDLTSIHIPERVQELLAQEQRLTLTSGAIAVGAGQQMEGLTDSERAAADAVQNIVQTGQYGIPGAIGECEGVPVPRSTRA